MQVAEPGARPMGPKILQDPFFAPVFQWVRDERRSCCICFDADVALAKGAECGRSDGVLHFVCDDCLDRHVAFTSADELRMRQAAEGRVSCPGRPCSSPAYLDALLAKHITPDTFKLYTNARVELVEQRLAAELQQQMHARLKMELDSLRSLDEKQRRVLVAEEFPGGANLIALRASPPPTPPHLTSPHPTPYCIFGNLLGVPIYWRWRRQAMAKWRLGRRKWRGPVPGPDPNPDLGGPDPAPLSSPPAPLGHGLAQPPPGHGNAQ